MAIRKPFGATFGAKPQISDLGHIGDTAATVDYRPGAKKRGYANMSRWGIDEVPKGPNALFVDYADPFHPTVAKGHPPSDVRWEYASPAQYRAYAKAVAAQKAKQAKAAKGAAPAGAVGTAGDTGTGGSVASALGGGTAAGTGSTNPFITDPGYLSALAAEQTGTQQADNALRAIQEQAIVAFGDPSLAQAAGLTVNPLTAAMAQASTKAGTSTVAGLQRQRDENQQGILDNLAAHGMLQSGQTGFATGQNQQAYGRDLYGATQTALSGLNAAAGTNVSTKQGLHSDTTNALLQAYQTYVQSPQFWGAAGVGTTPTGATPATAAPAARPGLVIPAKVPGKTTRALARPPVSPQIARNMRMG